jgi:hypothetical protein
MAAIEGLAGLIGINEIGFLAMCGDLQLSLGLRTLRILFAISAVKALNRKVR